MPETPSTSPPRRISPGSRRMPMNADRCRPNRDDRRVDGTALRESRSALIRRIAAQATADPERTALRELLGRGGESTAVDYKTLKHSIARTSERLQAIEPGGPIGVACASPTAFAIAALACVDADVPFMPLEPNALDSDRLRLVDRVLSDLGPVPRWLPIGDFDAPLTCLLRSDTSAPEWDTPPEVVMLQRTSGTTGEPKTVQIATGNLESAFAQAVDAYELTAADSFVSWSPLHHSMGLMSGMLLPLSIGATATIIDTNTFGADPVLWLEAIHRFQGTYSSAPVFGYAHCTARVTDERITGLDLSSWRVARAAAGPLWMEVLDRFSERFRQTGFRSAAFRPSYGLTEATLFVTAARAGSPRQPRATGTVWGGAEVAAAGTPVAGTSVTIVDPDTRSNAGPGLVGEIAVSGPQVASRAGEPEHAGSGDMLYTGDLGVIENGVLWVLGRHRDIVKIRGVGHSLAAIEQAVDGSQYSMQRGRPVALAAAGPGGEQLWMIAESPEAADPASVARTLARATARSTGIQASRVIIVGRGSIPMTASGKPRRDECLRLVMEGEIEVIAAWPT